MPAFDIFSAAVAAGAVTVAVSSFYEILRDPQRCRDGKRADTPVVDDAKAVPPPTTTTTAATTPEKIPFMDRCRPAVLSACRLCYRATATFLPAVTAVGVSWLLLRSPQEITSAVPALFSTYGARIADVVPLRPQNILESFDFGVAYQALLCGQTESALEQAAKIAGRPVSEVELRQARSLIAALAEHRGMAAQVWSSFTIVNVLWGIATCGLIWLIVPFIAVVLRPLIKRIPWQAIARTVVRVVKRCQPLAAPALFTASCAVAVEAARNVGTDTMSGAMLSLTGALLFNAGVTVSLARASRRWGRHGMARTSVVAWTLLSAAYVAPAAILHQSTLLGYVTVGCVAGAMGLWADAYPWGMLIGFGNRRDLISTAIGCGSLTWLHLLLNALQVHPAALVPFEPAVGVIGTTGYLLALDIGALINGSARAYVLFGVNVFAYFAAGEWLGLQELSNVAKTFGGLGLFTLYCGHFPSHHRDAAVVWLFFLFAGLYGACMYLNRHPELIAALFSGAPSLSAVGGNAHGAL